MILGWGQKRPRKQLYVRQGETCCLTTIHLSNPYTVYSLTHPDMIDESHGMQYALDRGWRLYMKVNETTMLFEDLTDVEAINLRELAGDTIMRGYINWDSVLVKMWVGTVCKNNNQQLLMASVVMLQRFLLSYIEHLEKR